MKKNWIKYLPRWVRRWYWKKKATPRPVAIDRNTGEILFKMPDNPETAIRTGSFVSDLKEEKGDQEKS